MPQGVEVRILSGAPINIIMKNFCIKPFSHVSIYTNGSYSPCCRIGKLKNTTYNDTLEHYWNSDLMRNMRKQFMNDERPKICKECWDIEDIGGHSERMIANERNSNKTYYSDIIAEIDDSFIMPNKLRKLEIHTSNLCNLSCIMCGPAASSAWVKKYDKVKDLIPIMKLDTPVMKAYSDIEHAKKDLQPFIDDIDMIIIEGGEALYEPLNFEILNLFNDEHKNKMSCVMLTNLNIPNSPLLNDGMINSFGKFTVIVSIDGTPEVNDYIRQKSNFEKIRQSWNILKNKNNIAYLNATFSLQALSALRMDETFEMLIKEFDLEELTLSIVMEPHLHISILPQELRNDIIRKLKYFKLVSLDTYDITDILKKQLISACDTAIAFCRQDTHDEQWETFVEFNKRIWGSLDKLKKIFPELRKWL